MIVRPSSRLRVGVACVVGLLLPFCGCAQKPVSVILLLGGDGIIGSINPATAPRPTHCGKIGYVYTPLLDGCKTIGIEAPMQELLCRSEIGGSILLVKVAAKNTSLAAWNPIWTKRQPKTEADKHVWLYGEALRIYEYACGQGHRRTHQCIGVIWSGSPVDSSTDPASYSQELRRIVQSLSDDLGFRGVQFIELPSGPRTPQQEGAIAAKCLSVILGDQSR